MAAAVAERVETPVKELRPSVFTVPTDAHESDGTLEWDQTTIVVVEVEAAGETGIGWTYGAAATAKVVDDELSPVVCGTNALDVRGAQLAMRRRLRNAGYPGIGAAAVAAVDVALWDLRAKLLQVP